MFQRVVALTMTDDAGTPLPDGGVKPDAGPPSRPASGDDGGCALADRGAPSEPLAWLALLGLVLAARRKRRRRAQPQEQ